jgi:hypothetical protein
MGAATADAVINVLAPLAFAGFVILGACARRSRRWANAFLIYAVLLSSSPGLLQLDAWPFSAWPLVAGTLPSRVTYLRLVAVDGQGREHEVDYRAWQPLMVDELHAWLDLRFPKLSEATKREAAAYLLERAEAGRRAARAGQPIALAGEWLGPLVAPYFILHPRLWRAPEDAPARPFVGIRLYAESWTLGERLRTGVPPSRRLSFEYLER